MEHRFSFSKFHTELLPRLTWGDDLQRALQGHEEWHPGNTNGTGGGSTLIITTGTSADPKGSRRGNHTFPDPFDKYFAQCCNLYKQMII